MPVGAKTGAEALVPQVPGPFHCGLKISWLRAASSLHLREQRTLRRLPKLPREVSGPCDSLLANIFVPPIIGNDYRNRHVFVRAAELSAPGHQAFPAAHLLAELGMRDLHRTTSQQEKAPSLQR